MKYKGHFDILKDVSDYSKVTIFCSDGKKEERIKQYTYLNGEVQEIIDYINWIVSEYQNLSSDKFKISFFRYKENPEVKTIDSIKIIKTKNGQEIKEVLLETDGETETEVYVGERAYDGERIISEKYVYPDFEYVIQHNWSSDLRTLQTINPNEDGEFKYRFDKKGYLIEYLDFKYKGQCKRILYEYESGKLAKMTEYPYLPFKKSFLSKSIKFLGDPNFVHETKFEYHSDNSLLRKETKRDMISDEMIETLTYTYE